MSSKIKTTLIIVITLASSLLGVKGYNYLPELGNDPALVDKVATLEKQLQIDRDTILRLQEEATWYQDRIALAKDPSVDDPKDEEIAKLKNTISGMEDQHKRTLEQMIVQVEESTDQVLEINRLQDQQPRTLVEMVELSIGGVVHILMQEGQASGFVIGPNLIGTARHVVEGQKEFIITTNDGHKILATRAIAHNKYDLGFIHIDDLTCILEAGEDINCRKGGHEVQLQVLELTRLKDCKLGQDIFSIGSTAGIENFNAVAKGNIQTLDPGIGRRGSMQSYGWSVLFGMTPEGGGGNSGCPVFTMEGKVVGVWVGSIQPNLHYAIPVDLFMDDLDEIELKFVQNKYSMVEQKTQVVDPGYGNQIAELQWRISNLEQTVEDLRGKLNEVYEWYDTMTKN